MAADLAGRTIAVNALKDVGETVIKAALKKSGVDPNSVKLTPLPFPSMRSALGNGQVDAIWTPEPFLSRAINLDGTRVVMNISLLRAQKHPEEIRSLLPAANQGIRLPIWSPLIDRKQIVSSRDTPGNPA